MCRAPSSARCPPHRLSIQWGDTFHPTWCSKRVAPQSVHTKQSILVQRHKRFVQRVIPGPAHALLLHGSGNKPGTLGFSFLRIFQVFIVLAPRMGTEYSIAPLSLFAWRGQICSLTDSYAVFGAVADAYTALTKNPVLHFFP